MPNRGGGEMTEGRLSGKRILIVEDEYFIAADFKRAFQKEGATVLGPVAQADRGMALAASGDALDAAVLDVNLEGSDTYSLADWLSERDVPHIFVTGYDGWSMPPAYRDLPRIAKPFAMNQVVDQVIDLIKGERS